MRAIVGGRRPDQFEPVFCTQSIKDPKHDQMRKALDIRQSNFKLRQDLKTTLGVMFGAQTFRYACGVLYGLCTYPIGSKENVIGSSSVLLHKNSCTNSYGFDWQSIRRKMM